MYVTITCNITITPIFFKKNYQFIIWNTIADYNSYNITTYINKKRKIIKKRKNKIKKRKGRRDILQ